MPDDSTPPPTPVDQQPVQPNALTGATQWFWTQLQTARAWLLVFVLATAAYILFFVRPFDVAPPTLSSDEVSEAWNKGIARLGIQALYPLQEDFRVGDVWAIVSAADGKPLLGKSVRVGHIPLNDYIMQGDEGRPIFSDTAELASGQLIRKQGRVATTVADGETQRIATAIAAFPTISINHTAKSAMGTALSWLGLSGSRAGQQYEQIRIRSVETYGAPTLEAYGALVAWCSAEDTQDFCTDDAWARKLLAATVSPDVLEKKDGKYTAEIELRLVTRVFMTREIETRRWVVDSSGAAIEISKEGKSAVPVLAATPTPVAGPNAGTSGAGQGRGRRRPLRREGSMASSLRNGLTKVRSG